MPRPVAASFGIQGRGKSWRAAGAGVLLACALGALGPAPAAAWTNIPAVSARARAPQTRPGIACSQRGSLCVLRGPGAARLCLTAGGAALAPQDANKCMFSQWVPSTVNTAGQPPAPCASMQTHTRFPALSLHGQHASRDYASHVPQTDV